jgi:hypothetical protein
MKLEQLNIQFCKETKKVKIFNNLTIGYWYEYTYDNKGNKLTFKDSSGYWNKRTYDKSGNRLTFTHGTTTT